MITESYEIASYRFKDITFLQTTFANIKIHILKIFEHPDLIILGNFWLILYTQVSASSWTVPPGAGGLAINESDLINCRKSRIPVQNRRWLNEQSFSVLNVSLYRLWLNNKCIYCVFTLIQLWFLILDNVYGSGTWLVSQKLGFHPVLHFRPY